MARVAPEDCEASGLQSEIDISYGDISRVTEKLVSVPKANRRLFYITTSGDAPEKIYEFEFDPELGLHRINHLETDSQTVDRFQSESDKVILSTRGKSCIGEAFKGTNLYKSLKFVSLQKKALHEDTLLSELILPKGSNDEYYKVAVFLFC
jgi:hypothetical protein